MRDPWNRRPHWPYAAATAVVVAVGGVVSLLTGGDDTKPAAPAADAAPTSPPPVVAPVPAAAAPAVGDPVLDAATAGVTAWAHPDPTTRPTQLQATTTGVFADAMTDVDPADIPDCTPATATHGPPRVPGLARVQVTCTDRTALSVDLQRLVAGTWVVASILPEED